jgi:hypothetical protein
LGVKLRAKDPRKGYVMKGQEVVGMTEAEFEPHATATLLRCTLSAVVKSLSEKCLLHKYLLAAL